jgi:hypothetical protein
MADLANDFRLPVKNKPPHYLVCDWLLLADCVEKLENRTTRKISPKLMSGHLCCCIARQRHCGGPVINFRGIDMVPHVAASQAH